MFCWMANAWRSLTAASVRVAISVPGGRFGRERQLRVVVEERLARRIRLGRVAQRHAHGIPGHLHLLVGDAGVTELLPEIPLHPLQ